MQRIIYSDQIPAVLSSITLTRKKLHKSLVASKIENSLISKILLAFSEATTNIILHNNANNPIIVDFSQYEQKYHLAIKDDGFLWNPVTYKSPESDQISLYAENGRGITLLNSITDYITYSEHDSSYSNILTLIWKKPPTIHAPSILIVDDDESTSRLYSAYLEESFNVTICSSGSNAIEWLKQNQVNLIISDIRMPDIDGISLRKYVNENSKTELIPFIFISAIKEKDVIDKACNLGIDDLLHKPISKTQLLQSINRVLHRNKQIENLASTKIQRKISNLLIPKIPSSFYDWKMSFRYRNTGLGGGDILLSHKTADSIYITVVDIMGHDEISKFFSYAYAGYIRGLMESHTPPLKPSNLLGKLSNIAFDDDLLSHITLTCCALCLNINGKVTIASAGHPAPILISYKSATNIDIGGVLPGLIPNATYPEITINLAPNERIAIFTDGLFESADAPESRLKLEGQVVDTLINTSSEEMEKSISDVMSTFDSLAGKPPNDDTLLLLIER